MSNLTGSQKVLLQLISSALFQLPLNVPNEVDWNSVYHEAVQQAVAPLAFSAAEPYLPEDISNAWNKLTLRILALNMRIDYEHIEVHNLLTQSNIPYVIIKGPASASYYPNSVLRTMGDVDFFVKAEELGRAGHVLESAGFNPVEHNDNEAHIAYYRNEGPSRSVWEMHWGLNGIPDGDIGKVVYSYFSSIIETGIELKTSEGCYIVPDKFHHGLVLLIHTAGHMINTGVGLRHLCDWAVFVNRLSEEEFIELFEKPLKHMGLWRFAQLLTQLSAKYLGIAQQQWAMENVDNGLLEAILLDIFEGGNFGHKDSERINEAKLMTNRSKGGVDDTSFVRQLVSTMNEKANIGLPITRKAPILLPVGWIYVGTRHLFRVQAGIRPQIHIKKMITGAKERRNIYKNFRLFVADTVNKENKEL